MRKASLESGASIFSNCCAYISVGHAAIHNAWIVNKAGIFDP